MHSNYENTQPRSFEDFEMNKLFLTSYDPAPGDGSDKLAFSHYGYHGFMNRYGIEAKAKFPEFVYTGYKGGNMMPLVDRFKEDIEGLDIVEVFKDESAINKTLHRTILEAPAGLYLTDPCYLDSSRDQAHILPAGPWEIVFKGCHVGSGMSHSETFRIREDDGVDHHISVNGSVADHFAPASTTMWILRPGTEFVSAAAEPTYHVGVDAGLTGVFPIEQNEVSHWDDEFLDAALEYDMREMNEPTPKNGVIVTENGVFTPTTYGDGTYGAYELYAEDGAVVGYMVSFTHQLPNEQEEDDEDSEADREYEQERQALWAKHLETLNEKYGDRGFELFSGSGTLYSEQGITGRIDGMLFGMTHSNRSNLLRVGVVDTDYRKHVTETYKRRNITLLGKVFEPSFAENWPDRKLFQATSANVSYNTHVLEVLDDMLGRLEPVPVEQQLMGG